jgi:hypothetical protein
MIVMFRLALLALVSTQSAVGLILTSSLSAQTMPVRTPVAKMHAWQSRQLINGALATLALGAALQGPLPVHAFVEHAVTAQPSMLLSDASDFQAKEAVKQAKARAAIEARRVKSTQEQEIESAAWAAQEAEKAERMVQSGSALAQNTIAKANAAKAKADAIAAAAAEGQKAAAKKAAAAEASVAQAAAEAVAAKEEAVRNAAARAEQVTLAKAAAERAKAEKIAAYDAEVNVKQKEFEEAKAARAAADRAFLQERKL